jgi:hypothetical protein
MIKINNKAVSEILGSVLLMAIAVSAFTIVYINFLSDEGPSETTYVTIVGWIEDGNLIFEHQRGEGINIDSKVTIIPRGDYRDKDTFTVDELLDNSISNGNGIWDIGERLFYPGRFTGWNVEAKIVDSKSNSIVFWGTLQDGYIEPAFGMGGWWRFNESSWSNASYDVEDSSGNLNHGIARNGANTINDVVSPSSNRSGIFNVDDYDDYVEVIDDSSLDITNQITMEAWIKPFKDNDNIGLLDQFGYTPYITNVSGDNFLFAVVSEDVHNQGNLHIVNITPHRRLSESSIVDVEYDFGEGNPNELNVRPIISHIHDNVYVVAYNSKTKTKNLSMHLKTFTISPSGSIDYTGNMIYDDLESNTGRTNRPSIVRVSNFDSYSIFAIAYNINVEHMFPAVGIIRTVNVSNDGEIKFTGEMAYFDEVIGHEPSIIHVSEDIFAITYCNVFNLGVVKTFEILPHGDIEYTGSEFLFDDMECHEPSFIHVSEDIFAIAYRGPNNNGILKTIKIESNGTIFNIENILDFESSDCFNPNILHHTRNHYIIAYSTGIPSYGKYSIIEIENDGAIDLISNNLIELSLPTPRCVNPMVIKTSERVIALVFESLAGGKGHPGYLMPIQMEYPSDLYSRGIYKLGSYGLYVNENKVYANINSDTINSSIVANAWNYVVLTYDRTHMHLYVNGILRETNPLTGRIKRTSSNLIFGDLFYGLIDEVTICDKVLSSQEVSNRFNEFAPIITSGVNSIEVTYNSAKITWDTNIMSNSIVRYYSTLSPMNIASDNTFLTSHSITLTGLPSKTKFYYEIESTSQHGYRIVDNNGGRYYTFTTENLEPNVPRLSKTNEENHIETSVVLKWIGGDEDGDDVTYDVYLGTTYPPVTLVSASQSEEFYKPEFPLNPSKTYYWQIIAWDSKSALTTGPIWSFTTKDLSHLN